MASTKNYTKGIPKNMYKECSTTVLMEGKQLVGKQLVHVDNAKAKEEFPLRCMIISIYQDEKTTELFQCIIWCTPSY